MEIYNINNNKIIIDPIILRDITPLINNIKKLQEVNIYTISENDLINSIDIIYYINGVICYDFLNKFMNSREPLKQYINDRYFLSGNINSKVDKQMLEKIYIKPSKFIIKINKLMDCCNNYISLIENNIIFINSHIVSHFSNRFVFYQCDFFLCHKPFIFLRETFI